VPEVRAIFLLHAARDTEAGRLLVTSYTHAGLAFEAEDFADAMRSPKLSEPSRWYRPKPYPKTQRTTIAQIGSSLSARSMQ
jgi:hypothetical protein